MKKNILIIIVCVFFINGFSQNSTSLKNIYSKSTCGLNYVTASVLLGKKMSVSGYPYYGIDQPASLSINSIPSTSRIDKAFIWWDLSGSDTAGRVIIKNPGLETDTFPGVLIGTGTTKCWGSGSAFRADVTSIITGNGNYLISGLPTDTTFQYSDVNGATLFIIYTDTTRGYVGTIHINDGYVLAYNNTVTQTMANLNVKSTLSGKAFMITSDFQNEAGTAIKMNDGPYLGFIQDFWDYEEKSTSYSIGQTTSSFGIQAPNDCGNLIMTGIYYQNPVTPLITSITRFGDTLFSASAIKYQWNYNDSLMPNAKKRNYIATTSGNYSITVGDNNNCYFTSTNVFVSVCKEKIKPNINDTATTLWTDSTKYSLQWYFNGSPILNATDSFYTATASGNYWIEVKDTMGCVANSDTILVIMAGIKSLNFKTIQTELFPNPNSGNFSIKITTQEEQTLELRLVNIIGQLIFYEKINSFAGTLTKEIYLPESSKGIYFLRVVNNEGIFNQKIIVN